MIFAILCKILKGPKATYFATIFAQKVCLFSNIKERKKSQRINFLVYFCPSTPIFNALKFL